MNESEQAQAIAEIKHNQGLRTELCNFNGAYVDCQKLLEIVDSQAQKIAADKKAMEIAAELMESQVKEIEWRDKCMFHFMTSETYGHCQEYLEKMRGNNEKAN